MPDNILPEITYQFLQFGFTLCASCNPHIIKYSGCINTEKYGDVHIDFELSDTLVDFPTAKINQKSQHLFKPLHYPHLQKDWIICYHDNSIFFDCTKSQKYIAFIINSVKSILENYEHDDMAEIKKEFRSYWCATEIYYGNFDIAQPVFISEKRVLNKRTQNTYETFIINLDDIPSIANIQWPLETIHDLLLWLDKVSYNDKNLEKYIYLCFRQKQQNIFIIINISKDEMFLGVKISPLSILTKIHTSKLRNSTIKNAIKNKRYLFTRFFIKKINPIELIFDNFDDDSNYSRSTLLYKKIALIGAGTLGSNLANILMRNGSGLPNTEATLVIIDNDIFEPENFSRHHLGLNYVGLPKAAALAHDLKIRNPYANIQEKISSVEKIDLNNFDIIIDSTGEEALTLYLSKSVHKLKTNALLISAWITDAGKIIEAFAQPNNAKSACFNCCRKSAIYTKAEIQKLPMRDSCQSIYIPFPVTASLQAAILVSKILNQHIVSPYKTTTFFKQTIEPIDKVQTEIIDKNRDCLICWKS